MDQPLVSVITPLFNRVNFIDETVRSVLSQDYSDLEYIVVDDGSTDGSLERIRACPDPRLRLFSHPGQANRGQSASINLGLDKARGAFIVLLDSDDTLAAGSLRGNLAYLQQHPEVGMVYGNGQAINAAGEPLYKTLPLQHQETGDPNRLLLDCYLALPGAAMVRREVYERAGDFEEGFRAAQDHDMALRIMESARVAYRPVVTFQYRKHADAISKQGLERRWRTGLLILERARRRYPYRASTVRKRRAVIYYRLGETFWRGGARGRALPYFLAAALWDPRRALRTLILGKH